MRVQNTDSDKGVLVEYYDASYTITEVKNIPQELPIFGGFYETDSNYFLLTGQTNAEESPDVEVFRITKYDKGWNRIGSVGLYDCNTTVPFNAGSARMTVSGKYLLIRTCHEMYKSTDGYNHQANVTIQVDMEKMEITDSYTAVGNSMRGYVSHSFNQFVKVEDNRIVAVDHGDAHPRSIVLLKYNTDLSQGSFRGVCDEVNIMTFPGEIGENTTGASVGGFEISNSSYLIAGNSVVQDENNLTRTTKNIFVAAVDKNTSEVKTNWITNYEEGDGTTSTPHFVKVTDDRYILLWSRNGKVYYTEIDGSGNQQGTIYEASGSLSDCVPIVVNNNLVWYTCQNGTSTYYSIDLSNLSNISSRDVVDVHDYEYLGTVDGSANLSCKKCGDTKQEKVVTSFSVWWNENGGTIYSAKVPSTERVIGTDFRMRIFDSDIVPADANKEMVVEVSDPEVISYTSYSTSSNSGTFTMLKEGTATITIYPKYNKEIAQQYTFTVIGHEHDYEVISTDENAVATLKCKICKEERQVQALKSMRVYWEDEETGFYYPSISSLDRQSGEELYLMISDRAPANAEDEIIITSSNPEVIKCTDLVGGTSQQAKLTMLQKGTATITLCSKYNPALVKTYTFTVDGGEEPEPKAELELKSAALKLENDITVIFKADAALDAEGYRDYYVEIVQQKENGETETATIQGVKSEDGQYYEFPYTGVNAKETGDSINATIFAYDADNNLVQGKTKENYSVKEYCRSMLDKTEDELTAMGLSVDKQASLKNLLVDLLNYSSEAQKYFTYKTDALANAALTDAEQSAYASSDDVIA